MKIQPLNFASYLPINSVSRNNYASTPILSQGVEKDTFVKSNNVAFKGNYSTDDLADAILAIGFIGAPLLLSIAASNYLAKKFPPEDIFTSDGQYICSVKDFRVESDKILADADDGIFKVKGTGINIDASKYDVAIPEKGIYKNHDGSVDIDLLHNKYIDIENGILIDPEAKISVIQVDDEFVNVGLPAFGSGYPTCPWDPRWNDSYLIGSPDQYRHEKIDITRSEYKKLFGYEPEHDPRGVQAKGDILPDRSFAEKIKDFFNGNSDEKYDIFGRRFFDFKDLNGNTQKIALDDESYELIKKFDIDGEAIPEIAKFIDNLKLEQYITNNYPEYKDLLHPAITSVDDFINSVVNSHNSDIIDVDIPEINSDTQTMIAETLQETVNGGDTSNVFDAVKTIIKEIIE